MALAPPIQSEAQVGTQTAVSVGKPDSATPPAPLKTEDLLKRISDENTKLADKSKVEVQEEPLLSSSDIEKIQDPFAKKVVGDLYKQLQTGFHKKFEKLSEERKKLDEERQASNTWTPDRVDGLLKDQGFIQAAQTRLQQQANLQTPSNYLGSQEEWSALSESEKQRMRSYETELLNLRSHQDQILKLQDDDRIRTKIPNYNPLEVDQFQQDILEGRISNAFVRELIWKALNHDKNVEQSYQFGLQDRNVNLQEKVIASPLAIGSAQSQSSEEPPERNKNEDSRAWFTRLATFRLNQSKRQPIKR